MIAATGYAKSHGLFPDAAVALEYKNWGGLAQMGFNEYISNERAIIMIAHVHALAISACAAFGPQVLGDTLTLMDGEKDEVTPRDRDCGGGHLGRVIAWRRRRSTGTGS